MPASTACCSSIARSRRSNRPRAIARGRPRAHLARRADDRGRAPGRDLRRGRRFPILRLVRRHHRRRPAQHGRRARTRRDDQARGEDAGRGRFRRARRGIGGGDRRVRRRGRDRQRAGRAARGQRAMPTSVRRARASSSRRSAPRSMRARRAMSHSPPPDDARFTGRRRACAADRIRRSLRHELVAEIDVAARTRAGDDARARCPRACGKNATAAARCCIARSSSAISMVCPKCSHHHSMRARARLAAFLDEGSGEELFASLEPTDPLKFRDSKKYRDRIVAAQKRPARRTR